LGKVPVQLKQKFKQNANVLTNPKTQHNEEFVVGELKKQTLKSRATFLKIFKNDAALSMTSGTFTSGSYVS
jgi:hypothetical protein